MNATKQWGALPTERATERTEYEAMRAQELQGARINARASTNACYQRGDSYVDKCLHEGTGDVRVYLLCLCIQLYREVRNR